MTKAKPVTPKSQASTPKGNLKGVKNTPIGKNKTPKFKATPTGKVALINGTPKSVNKQNTGNGTPKGKPNNSPAGTPKNKGNGNLNTSNSKLNSLPGKKNTFKGKSPAQKKATGEQLAKATKNIEKTENEDESDDSAEDINEGVEIDEEVSDEEVDSDAEDDSEDDDGIKGILGNSLAEDSDDDDVDFDDDDDDDDDEDDDEDEETENKGVKRFKGLQPTANDEEEEDEDDDDDDDDDDSSGGDDDDDSLNDSGPGLKALLGKSLAEDDDDEDFSGNDDEEDDEDDDISDDEDNEVPIPDVKNKKVLGSAEGDDGEDDDDDDDEEEEEEDSDDNEDDTETSKLSIFANDSEDDEEDEDEDEDEEDDTESRSKDDSADQDNLLTPEEIAERESRTIYVGNLPTDVKKGDLSGLFKQFGSIDTIRIRGGIGKDAKTSKKVAIVKKELHPIVQALHGFVRFAAQDSATKALGLNGHKLRENYLRIDLASGTPKPEVKKAVFLGNLPFRIQDNDIWQHFADCGKILSVRIVRDSRTGVGKGFGYVNFESPDSVALALKLSGTTLQSREIRVQVCSEQPSPKKQKEGGQKRPRPQSNQGGSPKKRKDNSGDKVAVATHNSQNAERRKQKGAGKQNKRSQGEQQRQTGNGKAAGKQGGSGFQGQKADNKKKQRFSKDDKKKKQIAAKFSAKSKKPSND